MQCANNNCDICTAIEQACTLALSTCTYTYLMFNSEQTSVGVNNNPLSFVYLYSCINAYIYDFPYLDIGLYGYREFIAIFFPSYLTQHIVACTHIRACSAAESKCDRVNALPDENKSNIAAL